MALLKDYKWWEEEIEKWQNPILRDDKLPEWYKFTLFNELYFLVAGGTVWIDSSLSRAKDDKLPSGGNQCKATKMDQTDKGATVASVNCAEAAGVEHSGINNHGSASGNRLTDVRSSFQDMSAGPVKRENGVASMHFKTDPDNDNEDVGRFLYLEGVEYIMWCTYDVHFYASFALLILFPKIELSIQREFAKAVLSGDGRKVKFLAEGNWGIRKVRGAIPHDLGTHDPWNEMNAYNIHDTSKWKDLNPKFVLQVYRDFAATGDMSFGVDVWPAVCAAMEYMEQFDRDGDGLIENDGFPDQTYDTWTVHGISAYCGCLWLAALQAAAAMALRLGDRAFADKCKRIFLKAKSVFEAKLWNASYFDYDSGSSSNSKSIQADQLAGQWYTASSGLPPLFDDFKIKSTLHKIYDFNVMKVRGGRMGAVNGMHPNGKVDETCMQSREIWTGVTYGVAATMILAGMEEQAFTTAEGIFTAGWSEEGYGYWFQTPEGWTVGGHYRSLIYMRPLAIWGMQWALSVPKAILEAPKINMMDRIHIATHSARAPHDTGVRKIEISPRALATRESSGFNPVDQNDPCLIAESEAQREEFRKVEFVVTKSKKLQDDLQNLGLRIKHHEESFTFLKNCINNLDESILDIEVSLGKYYSSREAKTESENNSHCQTEEDTIEQILQQEKSAAGILYQLKTRHGTQAPNLASTKDVLGIVATLGKVDNDNLSRLLSEYLGMETMLAIVCKTYEGVKALELYDREGGINKNAGIHGIGSTIGRPMDGRYLVICLENLRPYAGEFIADDPQRTISLLKPRLPNGECPAGFLGFAVNMINLDSPNLPFLTASGHGLRETLFYSLFSRLQVYRTRAEMLVATPFISDGAVSLDGGIIRSNGIFSLGNRKDIEVRFPISSGTANLPLNYMQAEENKIKEMKWEKERLLEDMQREQALLSQMKGKYELKKQEFVKFLAESSHGTFQNQVPVGRDKSIPR